MQAYLPLNPFLQLEIENAQAKQNKLQESLTKITHSIKHTKELISICTMKIEVKAALQARLNAYLLNKA